MKSTPKYKIIEKYIIDQIQTGKLKIGDQIPTENQLSEEFNIGRLTVSKALTNLSVEGYIKRIAGKGSFVQSHVFIKNLSTGGSFSNDMRSVGMVPGSKLIDYKLVRAKDVPEIRDILELMDDDFLHYFIRLRTGDNEPIAISYTYLSAKIIPALDINCLSSSLSEFLEKQGIRSKGTIYKMSAVMPTKEQKEWLKVSDTALLKNAHITYMDNMIPYEYIETYYLSKKFEYTLKSGIAQNNN